MMEQGPSTIRTSGRGAIRDVVLATIILLMAVSLNAQTNLIKNGEFNDNSGSNWSFSTNGVSAGGTIEDGHYAIRIDSSGTPESGPQLSQDGLVLENGERYTLSMKLCSEGTGQVRISIENAGTIIFDDTNAMKIPVTPQCTVRSATFLVSQATGNARLVLRCSATGSPADVSIDSVSLVKSPTPVITITSPDAATRWIAGSERQIVWKNSGTLPEVKIAISTDSGSTWSVITPAASNQKSFWWNIPAATVGDHCFLLVSDPAGVNADTSDEFRIVAAATIDRNEMVKNGQFLDTTDWRFSVNGSARASGTFTGDEFAIRVENAGSEP